MSDKPSNVMNAFENGRLQYHARQSACPFLNQVDLHFLKEIQERSENNLIQFHDPVMDELRLRIIAAGYSDEMNTAFKEMLKTPETINRDTLITILEPLKVFYQSRIDEELDRQRGYVDQLNSHRNVEQLSEDIYDYDHETKLRNIMHLYAGQSPVLGKLNEITAHIDKIINPKPATAVAQFTPKPAE